jgi:hypothetical protein
MSKYKYDSERARLHDDVEIEFCHLQEALELYMAEWKISGGGTTGHCIGSIQKRVDELYELFNEKA